MQSKCVLDTTSKGNYYRCMKKNKSLVIFALVLVFTMLALSLTGCLRFGLQRKPIISRLEKAGYTIEYETLGFMQDPIDQGHVYEFESVFTAMKVDEDGIISFVTVSFCKSDEAAEWVEKTMKQTIKEAKDAENLDLLEEDFYEFSQVYDRMVVYRYDRLVMVGTHDAVTTARNY